MVENQRRRIEISEDLGRRQAFGQQTSENLKTAPTVPPPATKIIKDVASRADAAASRVQDRGKLYNFFSGFLRKLPWIIGLLAVSIGLIGYLMSPPSKVTINGRSLPTPPGTWLASGKYGIPIIGETIEAMLSPFLFTERRFQKYGNVSSATVLGNNLYLMSGVEAMKIFYNQDLVTREGAFYSHFIIGMGGKILNMLAGDEYSERREIIMHSVADMKVVNSHIPTAKTFIAKYLKKWSKYDKSFVMKDEAHRLNSEIALNFILDLNTIGDTPEASENLKLVDKIVQWNSDVLNGLQAPPIPLPGTWFWRALTATRNARELYYDVLDKRMTELSDVDPRSSPETVTPMDRMALLMKKAKADSKHGLVTEIHHMMLAAEALIGNAMTDMMLAFSLYPEVWRKAKFEVMKEIPNLEDVTNWREALDRLKYVDAVSLETRRLFPFVPGMLGKTKKDIEFQGYAIPKGHTVAGLFFTTLHDPAEWTNPYEFNPERFFNGEPKSRNFYWAWVPQGTSYHQCPGYNFTDQVLKMFVVMLAHYDCSWNFPSQDYKQNMYLFNPEPKSGIILENFSCSKL